MNDTDSEYFFYGSADNNEDGDLVQYALYEPITDRFVLTGKYADTLKNVALLFSSRYQLRICKLHTATNFELNIMDNTCCYDWSIADKTNLIFNESIEAIGNRDFYNVPLLGQSVPLEAGSLLLKDRMYFLAAAQWIGEYENTLVYLKGDPFYKSEAKLLGLIKFPVETSSSTQIMQEVYDIIFAEFDFSIAEPKIRKLIEKIT